MNYHDVLAKLGVGTAHPGGFSTTQIWMQDVSWNAIHQVLEIGCGTGRTACSIASSHPNVMVTGVDVRPLMVEKAKQRARVQTLTDRTYFVCCDAHMLPFPDGMYDLIFMESVGVFTDVDQIYREVVRLLKPGGTAIAIEMMDFMGLPSHLLEQIQRFYGARQVPSLAGWKDILQKAGLMDVHAISTMPIMLETNEDYDPQQAITVQPEEWPEIQTVQATNGMLMQITAPYLAYVVLKGQKPMC